MSTSVGYDPAHYEKLPDEYERRITPEFREDAAGWVDQFHEFAETDGVSGPEPWLQVDAYSDDSEAQRDEVIRQLANSFGLDLEAALNASEQARRETELKSGVRLEPWMKDKFDIVERPDEASNVLGISRAAILVSRGRRIFGVKEIEVPLTFQSEEGEPTTVHKRLMFAFMGNLPA